MKKKKIRNYILAGVLLAIVAVLALLPSLASGNGGEEAVILSGTAENGSITVTLAGGGTLAEEDAVAVTVPDGVELTEYLVKNGDMVEAGDPVAKVDRASVMSAIVETQEKLDELAGEIESAAGEDGADVIAARTSARVKAVYAAEGDEARAVMGERGVLAVLSLDGRMAVTFETAGDVEGGQTVTVTFDDGTALEGRVESALDGTVTVTVTDDGPAIGETVRVTDGNGRLLGEGELYVHSPWNAVAYTGTVSAVYVEPEETVEAGDELLELTGGEYAAEYVRLLTRRETYEDIMDELFALYEDGTVKAAASGRVSGADESVLKPLTAGSGAGAAVLLTDGGIPPVEESEETDPADPTAAPDSGGTPVPSPPETPATSEPPRETDAPEEDDDYVNQLAMMIAREEDGGWRMAIQPETIPAGEYSTPEINDALIATMTDSAVYTPGEAVTVYGVSDAGREAVSPADIVPGDVLLFAVRGEEILWIDRVGHYELPQSSSEPTASPSPSPSPSPTPSGTSSGEMSGGMTGGYDLSGMDLSAYMSGISGGMGSMAALGGMELSQAAGLPDSYAGAAQERQETYRALTRNVLSIVPQETMTLEISVDELDISALTAGQTAVITVDALPGRSFEATVTGASGGGQNAGGHTKYPVTLRLEREALMLGGMNASAAIPLETAEDVLTVPVAALYDDGARRFVYTGYDGKSGALTDPVYVTTGLSDGENVEITSGLAAGDTFWYAVYGDTP